MNTQLLDQVVPDTTGEAEDGSVSSPSEKPVVVPDVSATANAVEGKAIKSQDLTDKVIETPEVLPSSEQQPDTAMVTATTEATVTEEKQSTETDHHKDAEVPEISGTIHIQHAEGENVEVMSVTLVGNTAAKEMDDNDEIDLRVDTSVLDENHLVGPKTDATIENVEVELKPDEITTQEDVEVELKPDEITTQEDAGAGDEDTSKVPPMKRFSRDPTFLLTPPTPSAHLTTFINPPTHPPEFGTPPPSSDIVTDLVNSLLYPGHTPSGVIRLLDFAFLALFATLVGMLVLTEGNLHVLAMLVLSVMLFVSIKWFIIELEKLDEEEIANLIAKKED